MINLTAARLIWLLYTVTGLKRELAWAGPHGVGPSWALGAAGACHLLSSPACSPALVTPLATAPCTPSSFLGSLWANSPPQGAAAAESLSALTP